MSKCLRFFATFAMAMAIIFIFVQKIEATLPVTGMAKPIADLKDYDGTYGGSPGTGTIGYTGGTLYRDNEDGGVTTHCNGEGCGSHPGVDIPVTSGTAVYSAYDGTVYLSTDQCTSTGWGGLVVIQSTTPYGDTVYFIYAHLKSRLVTSGWVSTGTQVGWSGGGTGDYCHGNSTGPHVHFQVDKNNHSTIPYWPSAGVNAADSSFAVAQNTWNPVVYVTAGYRWSFWQASNAEYWTVSNASSWGVSSGALWINGTSDPHVQRDGNVSCGLTYTCSATILADASTYQYVDLDLTNNCVNNPGQIYFTTSEDSSWSEAKSVQYTATSGAQTLHVYMGGNGAWTGFITKLRVDPALSCLSGTTYFNEITLQR